MITFSTEKALEMRANGKSVKEIAEYYDITVNNLYVKMYRARCKFKEVVSSKTLLVGEYLEKHTVKETAKKFKISDDSVYQHKFRYKEIKGVRV